MVSKSAQPPGQPFRSALEEGFPQIQHASPGSEAELEKLVNTQRMRMVLGHSLLTITMATFYALLLAHYLRPTLGSVVDHWLSIKLAAVAPRFVQIALYRVLRGTYSRGWLYWTMALTAIDGLSWGLAGLLMMQAGDPWSTAIIGSSLLGLCAIATFGLYPDSRLNLSFSLPIILPTCIWLAMRGDDFAQVISVGYAIFVVVMMITSMRYQSRIVELLRLRYTMGEAQKLAESSARAKGQFLAAMSHEMRTPLHGLLGLARLLQEELPPDPSGRYRQRSEMILRSGEHLLQVINDILDFSRIEAGKLEVNPHAFSPAAVVDDVVNMSRVSAADKGLALDVSVGSSVANAVVGDSLRLKQVLLNLIGNAVKFTDNGSIHLEVRRADEHAGSTQVLCFIVTDTGIGISAEDLPNIFSAFHQVDNSFARRYAGTGLGLSISREMARAMGGDITCTSTLHHGSRFVLTLPLPEADPGSATDAAPLHEQPLPGAASGRILLAEDNDVSALVGEAVLTSFGYTVECARNGQAAIERLIDAHDTIDLVLMDCHMPGMDGFEATTRIRAFEQLNNLRRLPVVALTANAFAEDRQRCLDVGMDDHLSKPFDNDELIRMLQKHLPQSGLSPRSTTPPSAPARAAAEPGTADHLPRS